MGTTKARGQGIERYNGKIAKRPGWLEGVDRRAKDKAQKTVRAPTVGGPEC